MATSLALLRRWHTYLALCLLSIKVSSCRNSNVGTNRHENTIRYSTTTTTSCFLTCSALRRRTADARIAEKPMCARKHSGDTTAIANRMCRPGIRQLFVGAEAAAQPHEGSARRIGIDPSIVDEILGLVYEANDGHCTSDEEDHSIDTVSGE
jgi:hypothetical protein